MTQGLVIKSTGSNYLVEINNQIVNCKIRGKIRLSGIRTTNPVAVGDNVSVELSNDTEGVITEILPRKNYIV